MFVCVRLLLLSGSFRRRRFFLFSLSQALGNPKPFWFGVPLVFLHPGHALRHPPVHLPPHIPQGIAPAPVFFFFRRRRSFPVRCFLISCLVGVGGLGGFFFGPWSWSLSGCCVASVSFEILGLVAIFSFFWVGGVPLAAFSPPLVSWFGVVGLGISAFLHLGQLGHPTRNPPGPHSPLSWRVSPHPSPAGSRR